MKIILFLIAAAVVQGQQQLRRLTVTWPLVEKRKRSRTCAQKPWGEGTAKIETSPSIQ
jgi:hypothetical protein